MPRENFGGLILAARRLVAPLKPASSSVGRQVSQSVSQSAFGTRFTPTASVCFRSLVTLSSVRSPAKLVGAEADRWKLRSDNLIIHSC